MNVTSIQSRTVKTYTLTIEDGEIRAQPYSLAGRKYRVESVQVVKRDGNVSGVLLAGSVIKKDGTVGLQRAEEQIYRQGEWPEWLSGAIKGLA